MPVVLGKAVFTITSHERRSLRNGRYRGMQGADLTRNKRRSSSCIFDLAACVGAREQAADTPPAAPTARRRPAPDVSRQCMQTARDRRPSARAYLSPRGEGTS